MTRDAHPALVTIGNYAGLPAATKLTELARCLLWLKVSSHHSSYLHILFLCRSGRERFPISTGL